MFLGIRKKWFRANLCMLFSVIFLFSGTVLAGGYGKKVPITGNTAQLRYFFDALKESRNKKVRIAHYGDSMIMGDIITEDLRINMQKRFGGNGAGFISIYSDDARMRATTFHSFSDDWNAATPYKRNPQKMALGISASVAVPSSNSWVKYSVNNNAKWLKPFKTARVFYSNAQSNSVLKYSFNNGGMQSAKLKAGNQINEAVLNSSDAYSLLLNGGSAQSVHFYGVSLENGNGVYVDNFPIKGNSGVAISDIPVDILKQFGHYLDYKLIIINFGVNVVSYEQSSFSYYESKMIKVIEHLKSAFPNTSILIVSIGDKSIKKGSSFVSDPAVQTVLKAQKNVAEKTHVAFWNLYEAMGGQNAITQWAKAAPALALKDYTHLTGEGGKVVGDLLMQALMDQYGK